MCYGMGCPLEDYNGECTRALREPCYIEEKEREEEEYRLSHPEPEHEEEEDEEPEDKSVK